MWKNVHPVSGAGIRTLNLMTFRTWVSSNNHYTRAPTQSCVKYYMQDFNSIEERPLPRHFGVFITKHDISSFWPTISKREICSRHLKEGAEVWKRPFLSSFTFLRSPTFDRNQFLCHEKFVGKIERHPSDPFWLSRIEFWSVLYFNEPPRPLFYFIFGLFKTNITTLATTKPDKVST